jgi:hypothetical protein
MVANHQGLRDQGRVSRNDHAKGCGHDACNSVLGRMTGSGQFLPPNLATAMEELASTPDAKAHNRYASL